MLKRDTSAGFTKQGIVFVRYEFGTSRFTWNVRLTRRRFNQFQQEQGRAAVQVAEEPRTRRKYWAFHGEFYWEDEGLTHTEVTALLLEREEKKRRRIDRAVTLMEQGPAAGRTSREPIPDDVKMHVWQRDKGRCVRCASQEKLEYDHIIPVSKGGSNTARNLQLLCEPCNRAKGASI